MTRLKRTLLVAAAFVALVLVALSAFLYRPTRDALERAQAFTHRRMVVARLGDKDSFRFFYATNRGMDAGDGPLEERLGSEREPGVRFGAFDTEIKPALGIGMLVNPTQWLQDEEIRFTQVQPLERDTFVEELREQVQASPRRSVLVVVHGFREAFPSALRKTAFVSHVLDIDSPILLFDWPGNQGSSPIGYRRARRVAEASGADLAEALAIVIREVAPRRLWLLANSMGAQVVADAFSVLYAAGDLADVETEIENVVLTAPDVDHREFDGQFKAEIGALADNLTVYVSSNDRALLVSRILNRGRRRGESTLGRLSEEEFAAAAGAVSLVEPGSDLVTLVDVTPVNRTRNFHSFSLETPEFFDDLFLRLVTEEMPRTRLTYPMRGPDGAIYWVLTGGR